MKKIILILLCLLCGCVKEKTPIEIDVDIPYTILNNEGNTLETRINPPEGYTRVKENSFGRYLRQYPLYNYDYPVHLYNGEEKLNQADHIAVFKLPIENKDLQQCADSIMRIYGEYYYSKKQYKKIQYHFVSGFLAKYSTYRKGYTISINNSGQAYYRQTNEKHTSYKSFIKYMHIVFNYASTLSMYKESKSIKLKDIQAGDIFIKAGSPGHVELILDVCEKDGKKAFLLGQGYMPAQEFHVLKNQRHLDDPWYYEDEVIYPFQTKSYTFPKKSLRRLEY